MFKVVEQVFGKVVQFVYAPIVYGAKLQSLVQIEFVAEKVIQSVLSNMGFIVTIAETVGKLVNRAVEEQVTRHQSTVINTHRHRTVY